MDKNSRYGRLYSEICEGFSIVEIDGNNYYFKHPTAAEYFCYYSNYDLFINEGKKKGLFTEKEKIEEAISQGWWTSDKESKIDFLKKTISNLFVTHDKLLYPSQKIEIRKQIKKNESILLTYKKEREEFTGYTLETYANTKLMEDLLILFTYKDKDFKQKEFSARDEYYNLTEEHVEKIKNSFNNYSQILNNNNLKRIAACGFFQNLVYLNDDAYSFWGNPIVKCTKYQIDLLLYGKMYKNIIKNNNESGNALSEDLLNDPDKLVDWIDNSSKDITVKDSGSKNSDGSNLVYSHVGASKDDLNKMGVKIDKLKGKTLLELAEEHGGKLEKFDYLKARENN